MLSYRSAALQADSTFGCTHFRQCAYSVSVCVAAMGADVARSVATPTISDACTVRLVEQVRGGKIVVGDHGTIGSSESRLRRCSRLSKDDATSDRRDVLATSEIGTKRTQAWSLRCPLFGVDRKWRSEAVRTIFDPELTLSFCVNALICLKTVVSATV